MVALAIPPALTDHYLALGWRLIHDTPGVARVAPPAIYICDVNVHRVPVGLDDQEGAGCSTHGK